MKIVQLLLCKYLCLLNYLFHYNRVVNSFNRLRNRWRLYRSCKWRPISSRQKMWEFSGNKWLKNQSWEQLLNQFRYRPCSSSFSSRLHQHNPNEKDKKLTNENSLISPSKLASFGRQRRGSWGTFVPSYFWGFSSGNLWGLEYNE